MATNKKKRTPAARKSQIAVRRRSHRAPKSILILECDPERLASDGITIARDVYATVQTLLPSVAIDIVRAESQRQLLADLGRCKVKTAQFDLVLIVGHGNQKVLALARDAAPPWSVVANWISPFSPRQVLLAACEAGRRFPSAALFDGIDSLQEIYGTPILSTENQLRVLQPLIFYLLAGKKVASEGLRLVQFANFALTGGIIFRQTRAEVRAHGPVEAAIWTGLEDWLRRVTL